MQTTSTPDGIEPEGVVNYAFLSRRLEKLYKEKNEVIFPYSQPLDLKQLELLDRQIAFAEAEIQRLPEDYAPAIEVLRRHSLLRRALTAIGRRLTAFAIRAALGNPWVWATIIAAFILDVWISHMVGAATPLGR